MKNIDVIHAFLDNRKAKTANLFSDGYQLINYRTTIGYWFHGRLFINMQKYSPTTSRIQNVLYKEAKESGIVLVTVNRVLDEGGLIRFAREYTETVGAGA